MTPLPQSAWITHSSRISEDHAFAARRLSEDKEEDLSLAPDPPCCLYQHLQKVWLGDEDEKLGSEDKRLTFKALSTLSSAADERPCGFAGRRKLALPQSAATCRNLNLVI